MAEFIHTDSGSALSDVNAIKVQYQKTYIVEGSGCGLM
jgi:hypothetical protein